jgi:hypothetical protein
VRADQHAGDDVAEHDRLAQQMEQDRDHAGGQHDDGQVMDERDRVHLSSASGNDSGPW